MTNETTEASLLQSGPEISEVPLGNPECAWLDAPNVVRHWAVSMAYCSAIFVLLGTRIYFANIHIPGMASLAVGAVWLIVGQWQYKALKRADPRAWKLQIPLSIFGLLLAFPIGTIAYGYVLAHWFKPEVKHWFGHK